MVCGASPELAPRFARSGPLPGNGTAYARGCWRCDPRKGRSASQTTGSLCRDPRANADHLGPRGPTSTRSWQVFRLWAFVRSPSQPWHGTRRGGVRPGLGQWPPKHMLGLDRTRPITAARPRRNRASPTEGTLTALPFSPRAEHLRARHQELPQHSHGVRNTQGEFPMSQDGFPILVNSAAWNRRLSIIAFGPPRRTVRIANSGT